jgi:hypothetical protein
MNFKRKEPLFFMILVAFALASVQAQPGNGNGPAKDNPPGGEQNYVFGKTKNWKPDPSIRSAAPEACNVALSASDPIIGEVDNYCRFVVVPSGAGKPRDFSVSVLENDIAHLLLSSKDAFHDAKGYYFQFSLKEFEKMKPGKHKLMLVIDHGKTTLIRSEKNQHAISIMVK